MDWTDLDQGRDRCQALVNAAMNFLVAQNEENLFTS